VTLGYENAEDVVKRCSTYRKRRKYTVAMLAEHLTEEAAARIRDGICSTAEGRLFADELVAFLRTQEAVTPEWKLKRMPPPDGIPRRRGRPPKPRP
jgi:hypothetical protein